MIDLSQTVKTRIQSDSRTFRAKITIGQTDYTDLREFYVSSGTEAGGSISIGSTYSTRLSVKLANVARNTIVQGTKVTAHVGVKIDDDLETFDDIDDPTVYSWFQIGEFYISEADPEDEDVIITAYDGFYLTQTLYDTEYTSTTTVANLVSEIATNCNFQYVSDSIMNVNYDPTVLTGLTYREVIGYLASFVGTNAVFDELGRLKFIWYSDISRTIDEDRIASPLQLGDYTYTLGTLECVVAKRELDEEGIEQTTTVKLTSGTLGKTISFPQLYMTQAQLDTIRTRMLGDGFSVRAADIVWNMAEPDIQAGDIVTLEDGEDTFSIPVMRMQLYIDGGCYGNITSLYEADTDASSTFEGSIAIAVERQYEELATFKKVVANMIVAERIRTQQLIADDIQAAEISATQITSGSLNTDEITISSENGGVQISGSTQIFTDENNVVRIRIGRDSGGNYTYMMYDSSGNVLMNNNGITTEGIPSETVTGEKIVITGNDGLYNELNEKGEDADNLQTNQNSLDGTYIKAKTVTANKIYVQDLVALDATIGGWVISDVAIHSLGKTAYNDAVRGVYLGSGATVSYCFLTDENGNIITDEQNIPYVYTKEVANDATKVCLGIETSDGYYIRFGDNKITINTQNFSVDASGNVSMTGTVYASAGEIGGFAIDATSIHTKNVAVTSNADESVALSNAAFTRTIGGTSRSNLMFALGSNFGVAEDGTMYASNGVFTGTIISTSGSIANWNITTGKIYGGDSTTKVAFMQLPQSSKNWVFGAGGTSHSDYGDCTFRVHKDGRIYSSLGAYFGSASDLYIGTDTAQTWDGGNSVQSISNTNSLTIACVNSNSLYGTAIQMFNTSIIVDDEDPESGYHDPEIYFYGTHFSFGYGYSNQNIYLEPRMVGGLSKGEYIGSNDYPWTTVYATNTSIQTSDRKKKDILGSVDFAEDLILNLKPVEYMWKDGNHRRSRMGFVAQDVAELCNSMDKNLSLVYASYKGDVGRNYFGEKVDDELLSWGLSYGELIAPMVAVIQNQEERIRELEALCKSN